MVRTSALPINIDLEVARTVAGVPVPIRLRASYLGFAAIGGALGTVARFTLTETMPSWQTLSLGTVIVNLFGPFLLGVLLQALAFGAENRRRRVLRLLVGTGFLGAFTSYAQLAVDIVTVAEHGDRMLAGIYGIGTITAGAVATWLGVVTASRSHHHGVLRR